MNTLFPLPVKLLIYNDHGSCTQPRVSLDKSLWNKCVQACLNKLGFLRSLNERTFTTEIKSYPSFHQC